MLIKGSTEVSPIKLAQIRQGTLEQRREGVAKMMKAIAFIASTVDYKHTSEVEPLIEAQVKMLYAITQIQEELGELKHEEGK